jgi:hypothetical protein
VVRHHRRKPGQGRSPSRRNYVRTPLVFVIPDCEILAKHCYLVRCQRLRAVSIRATSFRGRRVRMRERRYGQPNVHRGSLRVRCALCLCRNCGRR